jgi:hypothetical protein
MRYYDLGLSGGRSWFQSRREMEYNVMESEPGD